MVVIGAFILTRNIDKPFIGHHDWNGVQYGNMARNYIRYGLITTKLGQVENGGSIDRDDFAINTHYPATFPLLLSGSFAFLGVFEWSARLVPILFSLITVVGVYQLAKAIIGKNSGWIAALFLLVTPMFRYFAKMPVHEPLITAFVVWAVYGYVKLIKTRNKKYGWLMAGAIVGAQAIGWPGYYVLPWLLLYDVSIKQGKLVKKFVPLFLITLFQFGLFLLHNSITTGNPFGGGLFDILRFRLNLINDAQKQVYGFTLPQFIAQEVLWILVYFTKVQVLLAAVFLLWELASRRLFSGNAGLIVVLWLYGVTHAAIFRNAAYIHDYLLFYLGPGIALAATWSVVTLTNQAKRLAPPQTRFLLNAVVPAILVTLSFWERDRFYQALEQSTMHDIGREVGEELANLTQITDTIVSPTGEFALIFSKFTAFYADRNIVYYDYDDEPPQDADYLVVVKTKEPPTFEPIGFEVGNAIFWKKLKLL